MLVVIDASGSIELVGGIGMGQTRGTRGPSKRHEESRPRRQTQGSGFAASFKSVPGVGHNDLLSTRTFGKWLRSVMAKP